MNIKPGDQFGRYEIRSSLGAGGMGEVFRAWDSRLGREVAIKLIGVQQGSAPSARARFEQEARSASALNHPNIITIFDIGEEADTPFIVMELLEGESLRTQLATPLPLPDLLRTALHVAEALSAAHERGIIHRDLKPENIFITRDQTAKLLDFGLARIHIDESAMNSQIETQQRLTVGGVVLGTMGYAAPEILSGMHGDARSDIFSFGATLYEMASGTPAFRRATPTAMIAATLRDDPPPLSAKRPDIPPDLSRLISRCLAKEPEDRCASMSEVRDVLRGLLMPRIEGPAVPSPRRTGSLPAQRTRLIGRQDELRRIAALITDQRARLVTLTGPGGSGKTRLAISVAESLREQFRGAVYFVPLGTIGDPSLVMSQIASALGIPLDPSRHALVELITELNLTATPTLVVLDNFEQVIGAASEVGDLLAACPALTLVVTSREILRVYGEHDVEVPPLSLPDPEEGTSLEELANVPAIALFIARASAVDPSFRFTQDVAEPVVEICRRVDGLPLALELAAARVRSLPPRALLARLHQRLQILTSGSRDLPDRQQTLRRTIDWSYSLLSTPEQTLYRRLGVFVGGFTLEAVEAVADPFQKLDVDLFEGVSSLVDKSLLQKQEGESSEARFAMLEIIREYVREQLAAGSDESSTRQAHAAYYLVLAEEGAKALASGDSAEWLARFAREHDNLRAALDWLLETKNAEWGLRLCLALFHFWERAEHLAEGRGRLQAFVELPASDDRLRARALFSLGVFATAQGDHAESVLRTEVALALFRREKDEWGAVVAQNCLGIALTSLAQYDNAARHLEAAIEGWKFLGDETAHARSLSNLAIVRRMQGQYEDARRLYEEAAVVFARIGDRLSCAWALNHQGDLARDQKQFPYAINLYSTALEMFRGLDDGWGVASSLVDLAGVARQEGDFSLAQQQCREALDLFVRLGHRRGVARVLESLAMLAAQKGNQERALTVGSAAAKLREKLGVPTPLIDQADLSSWLSSASQALRTDEREGAIKRGAGMSYSEAIRFARAELAPASGVGSGLE